MAFEFEKLLGAEITSIPGMLVFDLPVHGDSRGWFKEDVYKRQAVGFIFKSPTWGN